MSLTFPHSPPSVFSQRARAHVPNSDYKAGGASHDFLRFHPLQPEPHARQNKPRGAQPVSPLPHGRPSPPQPRQNPVQHAVSRMQPPMHARPPAPMPRHGPQQPFPPMTAPQNAQGAQAGLPAAAKPPMVPLTNHTQPSQMQPPAMSGTPAPAGPPMPPTPYNAAAQFRRVNQGLPDGVMYEPLDDETMRILKAMQPTIKPPAQASIPETMPETMPETPQENTHEKTPTQTTSQPARPEAMASAIKSLAQDEHNAHIFYNRIAENAKNDTIKNSLAQLAGECEARRKNYTHMLTKHFDTDFAPQAKEINTELPFADAILLAIYEENKALWTLYDLLEQAQDTAMAKLIERIIGKKMAAAQTLIYCHIAKA
ncbi:MAG: hypothetical protein FWG38_07355 [Defluviitaleaceae bacterium]|nr:hypothetical protein [Defluviitaleaceae bacterium]